MWTSLSLHSHFMHKDMRVSKNVCRRTETVQAVRHGETRPEHCPELRLNAWSKFKWLSIRLVAAVCGRCLLGVPVFFLGDLLDLWPFFWSSFCVHRGNGAGISLICPGHIRFSFQGSQTWGIAATT